MPRCAFLTIDKRDGWFIDDDLVIPELKNLGWEVENVPWKAQTDWNKYDVVIIRSTWDYQNNLKDFLAVLQKIEDSKALLLNSLETVKWNIDKIYLKELEQKGIETVPTQYFKDLTINSLERSFFRFNTEEVVVKPMISANAENTYRIGVEDTATQQEVVQLFGGQPGMIQPFQQAIVEKGEYSLIFVNGKFSHALLKTVGANDYRVQEEHGGGVTEIPEVNTNLLKAADNVLNAIEKPAFYIRVDLVELNTGGYGLVEIELIEPALYFRFDKKSPKFFAEELNKFYHEESVPV
jgi:glutathione synthase/RimK-type ligase-like ATP-grasp enzyme